MKNSIIKISVLFFVAIVLLLISGSNGFSQEVMLDKMVKFGDLVCYPEMRDPSKFYYLPDQPRIAVKDGKPQFSFLKYARTQETGKAGIGQAQGGGIVHFLVTYGVSEDRVKEADKILKKRNPNAKIAGPIVYRKGNFALITSFKEGNEVTTKTVAVGKAPLMEGQKAAVSMALTREGAELLWESFKSDTPDISLVFDMEFAGIRQPYEATLEADWSSISKNDQIKAGFKYKWFGANIDMLFQELRQTGAIKITTKGENASMDKILETANEKLLQVMFDPAPSSSSSTNTAAQTSANALLDQALKILKESAASNSSSSGTTTNKTSDIIRDTTKTGFWASLLNKFSPVAYAQSSGADTSDHPAIKDTTNKTNDTEVKKSDNQNKGNSNVTGEADSAKLASEAYNTARRLYEEARASGFKPEPTSAALEAYEKYKYEHNPTGSRAEEVDGRIRMLQERLSTSESPGDGSENGNTISDSDKKLIDDMLLGDSDKSPSGSTSTDKTKKDTDKSTTTGTTGSGTTSTGTTSTGTDSKSTTADTGTASSTQPQAASSASSTSTAPKTAAQKKRASGSPGFSFMASYQMKRIKRTGKMVYNMNHYATETQAFAMAENIGDIFKHYGNDSGIFRAVTIDDPVFKQREILATLDGQDASTFTKYLNFVTVKMKKRHQAGDVTTAEIVVTPESFNSTGNNYSMTYGWKDDSDRTAWLNYEYQAIWSFHGGSEIRTPWTETDSPMLALVPPYHYRTVSIEGDGNTLTDAEVRHGVVTFSCRIGDKYITRQATIRNDSPAPSMILDIPEDPDNPETQVDITWYLTKGRKLTSEKSVLEGDILYWDELPKGGI